MCGIVGMMSLTGRPLQSPTFVEALAARLVHRGPDEEGYYTNPSGTISLGHRRLRIIDLVTGRQPLFNEDESVAITFNGEIYGFQSLRSQLEERGHCFKTHTDTEVIVHLYEDKGAECLQSLKGMFAFGIWDEGRQLLFLARDRLGKKPLYYTVHEGQFLFASELQALFAIPGLSRELDHQALDLYLTFGYVPAPRTIYRGIQKLQAGHYLIVKPTAGGEIEALPYWAPRSQRCETLDWEEAKEELITRIRTATALRMVSDVPLGCFLSGGVDSSTVLSFMAELSSQPVKTFSIGFREQTYSELSYAQTIARHVGADHHEFVLEPHGIGVLEQMMGHFGEPFADPAALPMWYLAEVTRSSVTVALTGDGGDELFGGYGWYRTGRLLHAARFVPRTLARAFANLAGVSWPRPVRLTGRVAALLASSPGQQFAALRQMTSPAVKERMLTPEFLAETDGSALRWLAGRYDEIDVPDALNRMMAADLDTYMAEDLLVKVDRTSMAHSLECRSPLLDTDLVEWVLGLPSNFKLSSGNRADGYQGKRLLREAVRDRLPPKFLDRPKQGFEVPLEQWLRTELRTTITDRVLHGSLRKLGAFDFNGLQSVLHEHLAGTADHSATLWSLLVLAVWAER
ncbi:MAG: asparagine synthase (glutamine-hydrolyzing) [Nitrospirota bacterium]